MSDEAAFSAAQQRDSARLHEILAGLSGDELRELSDTAGLLRAAAEVVLSMRERDLPIEATDDRRCPARLRIYKDGVDDQCRFEAEHDDHHQTIVGHFF